MNHFHCSMCNKLLGKIDGNAEIKCPRCKTLNSHIAIDTVRIGSLQEFNKALKEAMPEIREKWDAFMNEELPQLKHFK